MCGSEGARAERNAWLEMETGVGPGWAVDSSTTRVANASSGTVVPRRVIPAPEGRGTPEGIMKNEATQS